MAIKLPIASPSLRLQAHVQNTDLNELAKQQADGFVRSLEPTSTSGAPTRVYPHQDSLGAGKAMPLRNVEKLTASNMLASQQIPTVTHHDAFNCTALDSLRADLLQATNYKVSALAVQVMSLARTLRAFPRFNASLIDNGNQLWIKEHIHIGIAVDTSHGLMVPVIQNADQLGLSQITDAISTLATLARNRKLKPEQIQLAGMSLSNLGGIGGRGFNPMINPPEVAILGVMKTRTEPHWNSESFEPAPFCPLSLSYDHRVINGAEAQRFLNHFMALLVNPYKLLYQTSL